MSTPGEPPRTRSITLDPRHRNRAFWVCVAVAALTILDISKVNVGLASIENALGGGSTELQLIVSGYILAFGLVLVPFGRIGDQRSRRTLMIVGLIGFAVASALCALAPNIWALVIARFFQGMAAGIQMPQVMGTIQQLYTGKERGAAFGLFGATIGLATAFGPTIGGLLIAIGGAQDGWRWIFWMNVPLCAVVAIAAIVFLPEVRKPSGKKLSLDPVGLILFALTVVTLMIPFLFTTGSPSDTPVRWWLLVPCVLFLAAFVAWERRYARRGGSPLVPLRLFRVTSWRNGNLIQALFFAAMPSIFLLTALFLQNGLGLAAVYAGMVTIGFALASAVTSWWGGKLVARFGRSLVIWGLSGVLIAIVALVLISDLAGDRLTPWLMVIALTVGGVGGGFVISPNQTLTLADIPPSEGGLAGSVGQLGQRIGNAVGAAIALSLFYSTIFREHGTASQSVVYHNAYSIGLLSAALFVAAALVVALLDLSGRRRAERG
ncbi:MFS transporter [Microbacterium amylolyticum]|uniref:Multidrug resistance protein n=1 Tax=Microbacterium amylolyticum TaxID=936337 RepID=A0ABS4ZKQ0_9MICO|nr:MFS transporter [Microbacterium amylolyticum]MBP2437854.1 multidrug resistance protein [Microbacterium amylolyticum]